MPYCGPGVASARADTSPALKGRGSVVTSAKGRVYRTASWKVGPACAPCPHPGLLGKKLGQDWLHKVFSWLAGGSCRPVNQEQVARFSICLKRLSSQSGKNFPDSIFLTRLRPLGCRLLPGAKKGGTPGFSFDGRGFCIKCKPPLAIKHETYKRKYRLEGG